MLRTLRIPLVIACLCGPAVGCSVFQGVPHATRQTLRVFKPRPQGYRDMAEETDDQWDFVGQEGRGDRPLEYDPDPWWQRWFMSAKARDIERNMGIGMRQ